MATPIIFPSLSSALWRGFRRKCPRCGQSSLFTGYLKLPSACDTCDLELGHIRADDFPPYLTIVIVGHIIVPLILVTEKMMQPSIALHLSVWLPLTLILTFWFLPRLKGVVVGWMLHLGLRGDETQ